MASTRPDPRLNVYRDDLAGEELRGVVDAPRYVPGQSCQIRVPKAPVCRQPQEDALLETEVLGGEFVRVYEEAGGWAWCQLETDHYVGYVPNSAITRRLNLATSRIVVPRSYVFARPDTKSKPVDTLFLNGQVTVEETCDGFAQLRDGGFVHAPHVSNSRRRAADFVAVAEQFVGTPYLWGGKSQLGIDCSGLVQLAMQAAGLSCPRDSDMMLAEVGRTFSVTPDGGTNGGLRRGDLVFWTGHVGIMVDANRLLHANAGHMLTMVEPLKETLARYDAQGVQVLGIRRPPGLSAEACETHSQGAPSPSQHP